MLSFEDKFLSKTCGNVGPTRFSAIDSYRNLLTRTGSLQKIQLT